MPRVLLDACVPHWLRTELRGLDVVTARYAGLDQLSDSKLLTAIEGRYDVLVTLDSNISHQQNLASRTFALIILSLPDQSPEAFRALVPELRSAIAEAKPGEILQVR